MEKEKLIRIFDRQASRYGKNNEPANFKRWRKKLLSHAEGDVLELAVGAGANFPYYPAGVKVTAADFSEVMLNKARQMASACNMSAEWICTDIEKMEFEPNSFDTIVSTLSFCCYENPSEMFKKVQQWCRPGGKILLIEHGISTNIAISSIQRILNPLLYKMIGCHHTRDMLKLVHDSGLTVERSERHWFNMMNLIWASPAPKAAI